MMIGNPRKVVQFLLQTVSGGLRGPRLTQSLLDRLVCDLWPLGTCWNIGGCSRDTSGDPEVIAGACSTSQASQGESPGLEKPNISQSRC